MVIRLDHHPRHCFWCVWRLFPGRINWRRKTLPQNKLHFMLQPWRKEVWGKSYCFLATCCYLLFVNASTLIHTWWTYCCIYPLVTIQTHLSQSQKADREQTSLSRWIIMGLLGHLILSGYQCSAFLMWIQSLFDLRDWIVYLSLLNFLLTHILFYQLYSSRKYWLTHSMMINVLVYYHY